MEIEYPVEEERKIAKVYFNGIPAFNSILDLLFIFYHLSSCYDR